jgi:hypothetical protein
MSTADTESVESRWFVLPLVASDVTIGEETVQEWTPKYLDREGIHGWSGTDYHFESETFPGLPFAGETMFVGEVRGTTESLDAVADESGARGRRAYGLSKANIANYLNDRLGRDRTFEAWGNTFRSN